MKKTITLTQQELSDLVERRLGRERRKCAQKLAALQAQVKDMNDRSERGLLTRIRQWLAR